MNRTRLFALIFLAVSLVQLAIPASRVWQYEQTLEQGRAFKFVVGPVDPYDAFRGRYVALNFLPLHPTWKGATPPEHGTPLFVRVEQGAEGFATFGEATLERPDSGDYLRLTAGYSYEASRVQVIFPFDRFYMEESIAPEAEKLYRDTATVFVPFDRTPPDNRPRAHAVVRILNGRGVIEQVYLGDKTLAEATKAAMKELK